MTTAQISPLPDWHEALPGLIALIGTDGFARALDAALQHVAPFDLSCIFAYPGRDRPLLLHNGLGQVSSSQIMANYLNGTYLLDAVYSACLRRTPAGLHRLETLAPDDFFAGEYYNSPDVHPCISMESGSLAEEIVFLVPVADSLTLAYSLLRQNGSAPFSDVEFERLQQTVPMVLAFAKRHWQDLTPAPSQPIAAGAQGDIEQAFATFAPAKLTEREQTIVSLILRGHSSVSIGKLLDIAEGTVKIHRKHIHTKLEISSQTELFNLFIQHLLARK